MVDSALMYHFAFIFKCKQFNTIHHGLPVLVLNLNDEGNVNLQNVGNHSANDSITSQKT
jgi:hypothetical protein